MLYTYFTFPSTFYALKAEKVLQKCGKGGTFKMVPVPRRISSSCGTALRSSPEEADSIEEIFHQQQVMLEERHTLDEGLDLKRILPFRKG